MGDTSCPNCSDSLSTSLSACRASSALSRYASNCAAVVSLCLESEMDSASIFLNASTPALPMLTSALVRDTTPIVTAPTAIPAGPMAA